jgi:hypothetical protein
MLQGTFDGQSVAIKVPDAGTPDEAANVDLMRKEAAVLAGCHHRSVQTRHAGNWPCTPVAGRCLAGKYWSADSL